MKRTRIPQDERREKTDAERKAERRAREYRRGAEVLLRAARHVYGPAGISEAFTQETVFSRCMASVSAELLACEKTILREKGFIVP